MHINDNVSTQTWTLFSIIDLAVIGLHGALRHFRYMSPEQYGEMKKENYT
jgi:hypothetical protein